MVKDNNICKTLEFLLDYYKLTGIELSRATNIPPQTIARLLHGQTPDPRVSTVGALANYFKISVEQIMGTNPLMLKEQNDLHLAETVQRVPVLPWENLGEWDSTVNHLSINNWSSWVYIPTVYDGAVFALEVMSNIFKPPFYKRSIVIVKPNTSPQDGQFIVLSEVDGNHCLIGQHVSNVGRLSLKNMESGDLIEDYEDKYRIHGVVVQIQTPL